jgi:hypothetical protein
MPRLRSGIVTSIHEPIRIFHETIGLDEARLGTAPGQTDALTSKIWTRRKRWTRLDRFSAL